jgi:hypothetical protein
MAVEIEVTVVFETDKAFKVLIDGTREVWLPKSQIIADLSDDLEVGDSGTMLITDFIAAEKGLD